MKHFAVPFLLPVLFAASLSAHATLLPPEQWVSIELSNGELLDVVPVTVSDAHGELVSLARTRDNQLIMETGGYWYEALQDGAQHWYAGQPLVAGVPDAEEVEAEVLVKQTADVQSLYRTQSQSYVPQRTPFRFSPEVFPAGFEQPLLIIRVAFSDSNFVYSDSDIAQRFYAQDRSVASYFDENSYGRFNVVPAADSYGQNNGVVRVTLNTPHPDFGNQFGGAGAALARAAAEAAAPYVNVAAYDRNGDGWLDPNELAVVVMVAGYEQAFAGAATSRPRIWAHKANVSDAQIGNYHFAEYAMFGERHQDHLATIGVICHELGHLLLDLPDLYSGSPTGASIGRWGLMGQGGWNSDSGQAGDRPGHLLAWSKEVAGFMEPKILAAGDNEVSLRAVSDAADAVQIQLDDYGHGQRLILENRNRSGYDAGLPGSGLLITRVNDQVGFGAVSQASAQNPLLVIEEADGRSDLANNTNPGEPSDVFSTLSAGLQLSPQPGFGDSSVQLMSVDAGLVAYTELTLTAEVKGSNIGLDDLPPNAYVGAYGSEAAVRMTLDLGDAESADGVDVFLPGKADVTVRLLTSAGTLLAQQDFTGSYGWNRMLLSAPVAVSSLNDVVVEVISSPLDYSAPLAIDTQGMASGLTEVDTGNGYHSAAFDASVRLLVGVSPVAASAVSQPVAADSGDSASSSGGGGGAALWILALLPLLILGRRRAVAV